MRYTLLSAFIMALIMSGCTEKLNMSYQRTGMVICQAHDKMTITLVSEGQAETLGKAIDFAERNAIENLLFKGIPKSNQEKPMISDEYKVKNDNPRFIEDFIVNGGYKNYITSSMINDDFKSGNVHLVSQKIIVDLTNLRKHLEKNGIVQKFGLY